MSEAQDTDEGRTSATAEPVSRRRFLGKTMAYGTLAALAPGLARATTEVWEEGDLDCKPNVLQITPAYATDSALLATFMSLSEALTGVSPLDQHLGRAYMNRFATHPQLSPSLPPLVAAFRELSPGGHSPQPAAIAKAIFGNANLKPAAEQLIYLWYVSAFFLPLPDAPKTSVWQYGSPEDYGRGLLWSVIRAHAPMTHGGPYGYWADAPSM